MDVGKPVVADITMHIVLVEPAVNVDWKQVRRLAEVGMRAHTARGIAHMYLG